MLEAMKAAQGAHSTGMRYGVGVALGIVTTFFLFMLMQAVIANPKAATDSGITGKIVDFVRLTEDQEVQVKQRKVKPPPPPDEQPPSLPPQAASTDVSIGIDIGLADMNVDLDVNTGGFASDGEYLPIVKVAPIYPRRAEARGIEGYVIVEFVVTTTGSVRDPVVVEAKPPGIFDRAALNAALKFKYKPRVINGTPTEVSGVQNRIIFNLEGG